MFSLRNEDAALDAVQDAMIKLSVSYGARPAAEFPMLFQRILRNVVTDSLRRQKVRNKWVSLFSSFVRDHDDGDDPLDALTSESASEQSPTPETLHEQARLLGMIEHEIGRLPARQL